MQYSEYVVELSPMVVCCVDALRPEECGLIFQASNYSQGHCGLLTHATTSSSRGVLSCSGMLPKLDPA
jgi:hypothetical protein